MDWKTFTVQVINTVAWPVVVLMGLYLFKDSIKELLKSLSQLKIGNATVLFGKKILAREISNKSKTEDSSTEVTTLSKEEILEIPDDDYEFMQAIAGNQKFMPVSKNEVFKYNSLVNHGYFVKDQNNVYQPTKNGAEILSVLNSIYYQ